MIFLYIIQSEANGRYYIGSSQNPERRLAEHNSGHTRSLKHLRPLKLVFKQPFATRSEAVRIERKLKKSKSRDIIKKIISDGEIKMGSW